MSEKTFYGTKNSSPKKNEKVSVTFVRQTNFLCKVKKKLKFIIRIWFDNYLPTWYELARTLARLYHTRQKMWSWLIFATNKQMFRPKKMFVITLRKFCSILCLTKFFSRRYQLSLKKGLFYSNALYINIIHFIIKMYTRLVTVLSTEYACLCCVRSAMFQYPDHTKSVYNLSPNKFGENFKSS